MIAAAGHHLFAAGARDGIELEAAATLPLPRRAA
jgi:hypothetical protein